MSIAHGIRDHPLFSNSCCPPGNRNYCSMSLPSNQQPKADKFGRQQNKPVEAASPLSLSCHTSTLEGADDVHQDQCPMSMVQETTAPSFSILTVRVDDEDVTFIEHMKKRHIKIIGITEDDSYDLDQDVPMEHFVS